MEEADMSESIFDPIEEVIEAFRNGEIVALDLESGGRENVRI